MSQTYRFRKSLFSCVFTAFLALASLLSVSCWHPLFDPSTSASQILADRLGDPVLSFTIDGIQLEYVQGAWFVPRRIDPVSQTTIFGILARPYPSSVQPLPLQYYPATDTTNYFNSFNSIENLFGDFPILVATPDQNPQLIELTNNDTFLIWDLSSSSYTGYSLPVGVQLAGAGCVAHVGNTGTLSLAYEDSGDLEYESILGYSGGVPGFLGGGTVLSFPALAYLSKPGAFLDTGTYLYLSCRLTDGSTAIFRWESAAPNLTPVRYPAAYGPLIAALSDGRLIAFGKSTITVLSKDLRKQFSFPSGSLRFVHERYDGVKCICVFTRVACAPYSHDDSCKARIEIFEIPTAELDRLGS